MSASGSAAQLINIRGSEISFGLTSLNTFRCMHAYGTSYINIDKQLGRIDNIFLPVKMGILRIFQILTLGRLTVTSAASDRG